MSSKRGSATKGGGSKKAQQQQQGFASGPRKFVRDVQGELKRINWPDRDQLRQSTAVVLIIVLVLTAYVYALDLVFQNLARLIFSPQYQERLVLKKWHVVNTYSGHAVGGTLG